jgi:cytochrome c551
MRGLGPAAGGPLGDAEADSTVAYLRQHVTELAIRNIAYGAELFVGTCADCHGLDGDAVAFVDLKSPDYVQAWSDADLASAIRRDTNGGRDLSANATRGSLTRQTAALLAFLKSSAGLPSTAALAPSASRTGGTLYAQNCASCHGIAGNVVPSVQLKSPVFLALRSRDVVVTTVRSGNDKGMPAWAQAAGGPLTDDEIESVVTYLFRTAGALEVAGPEPSAGAPVSSGPRLYSTLCAGCHGVDRSGGVAPPLLPESLTLSDAAYEAIVANGRGAMPGWGDQGLTEADIAALVEFTRSEPIAVGLSSFVSAGIGNGLSGRALYQVTCQNCHGQSGLQIPQCPLGSSEWLSNLLPGELERVIAHGKPAAGMPAWSVDAGGPLTSEQIASIVAYVLEEWR